MAEIEVSKKPEDTVHNIFFDPSGTHLIITMTNGDNYYLSTRSKKVRPLTKLKVLISPIPGQVSQPAVRYCRCRAL